LCRRLDGSLANSSESEVSGESAENNQASLSPLTFRVTLTSELRWLSQVLTLLPADPESERNRSALLSEIATAVSPSSTESIQLASLGHSIRQEWKRQRKMVADGFAPRNIPTATLVTAEQRSRLLPAFDAMVICPGPEQQTLTSRLFDQLTRDYRELQIRRRMISGWIMPTDRKPWSEHGWYRQSALQWAGGDTGLQQLLHSKGEWDVRTRSAAADVSFVDDGNQSCETVLQLTNPDEFQGTATFTVLGSPDSDQERLKALELTNSVLPLAVEGNLPGSQTLNFGIRIQGGEPLTGDCEPVEFLTRVFFRGRLASTSAVQVDPCEGKSWLQIRTARLPKARLQLQSPDIRPIAFVLDWSGSMKDPLGHRETTPRKRFEEAAEGMSTLLEQQHSERKASLRVFGHRAGATSHNGEFDKAFEGFPIAELSTVPTKDIDPLRDAQQLIQSSLLDTAQRKLFEDALERLKRAEPFGSTPLVYALIQAVRTDLQSRTGIVIAITDGEALDAGADPDRDKRAELKRLLDESG
ncbi:MAG: hypothetical protein KDA96_27215, partial [Planctomycetaceae bacterium]|nr:hypothetical protein [Planctomycetaceae bacterium]